MLLEINALKESLCCLPTLPGCFQSTPNRHARTRTKFTSVPLCTVHAQPGNTHVHTHVFLVTKGALATGLGYREMLGGEDQSAG